jgi:hypothetical protein
VLGGTTKVVPFPFVVMVSIVTVSLRIADRFVVTVGR